MKVKECLSILNLKRRQNKMDYNKITLEECFVYYHTGKVACECDADKEEVIFCKE